MNKLIINSIMIRNKLEVTQENLLSDICKAVTGKTPAKAALPKKVEWNLTPSSSLNAIT